MTLVLGSSSPRRYDLMAMLQVPFEVEKPDVDESLRAGEPPAEYVQRLSREKAAAIAARRPEAVIAAADTIVVFLGEVFGKPRDVEHAREMLRRLRGQQHRVLSGVTVHDVATGKALTDLCESKVTLREMSDDEVDAYVASGDPLDKAAAYAIQNTETAPVETVVGCPANVMGLPMCHVVRALRRQGVTLPDSPPLGCRIQYGYQCAIAEEVMPGLDNEG